MAHDPKAVANYILDLAARDGYELSPMKLIKLVYISHGWSLGVRSRPLIREQVEAWKYGPVVSSLYHHFKRFGNSPIQGKAQVPQRDQAGDPNWSLPTVTANIDHSNIALSEPLALSGDKKLIDRVWDQYKDQSAVKLSEMTHAKATPWDITWNERDGSKYDNTDISVKLIEEYYRRLADEA